MSISYIPDTVKLRLWGKSAGRCEYRGCGEPLWLDSLTKAEFNIAYIAHIYGDSVGGPRYEQGTSERLKADLSNLMLLCDEHHRLIDKADVLGHPVAVLQEMKEQHEARMELLSAIRPEMRSEVLMYGAKVGEHSSPITFDQAAAVIVPHRYPARARGISIGLKHSTSNNRATGFWEQERKQLTDQFNRLVRPLLEEGGAHFSVFALAPQPLLIALGSLFSDIQDVEVYQLHREPTRSWRWDDEPADGAAFQLSIHEPAEVHEKVAIAFEMSANIDPKRISRVLGEKVSIWSLRLQAPHNDALRTRSQLSDFRNRCRTLFSQIAARHGRVQRVHVFPAMPVAAAVELGRVHMPKADPPMKIFDEDRQAEGFVPTFSVPLEPPQSV